MKEKRAFQSSFNPIDPIYTWVRSNYVIGAFRDITEIFNGLRCL